MRYGIGENVCVKVNYHVRCFLVSEVISAKDMDILWLPTIVATSKTENKTVYSETKQISITDYATAVVLGECFYDEDATEEEKSADKTVAAALINYSNASADALAVTTPETKIVDIFDNWHITEYNRNGNGDGFKTLSYFV